MWNFRQLSEVIVHASHPLCVIHTAPDRALSYTLMWLTGVIAIYNDVVPDGPISDKMWRHYKETLSILLAFREGNPPVSGGFPSQWANITELWCVLSLNTLLDTQSSCRWFETWGHLLQMFCCRRYNALDFTISWKYEPHYMDVIMGAMASHITCVSIVCSTVCSGADHRKHQSSWSLDFLRENHLWPVDSRHKWPVTRKMFSFDDVILWRSNR